MDQPDLPSELEALAQLLDTQPSPVRELFHYALVMLMIEKRKANVVERHIMDAREYLTIQTLAGDTFSIVKPLISDDELDTLMILARDVLREDQDGQ